MLCVSMSVAQTARAGYDFGEKYVVGGGKSLNKDSNINKMTVSFAPHIISNARVNRIMLDVIIALIPAFIASIVIFGARAALVTSVCIASCVFFEWAFQKLVKREVTIRDCSAVITGVLLAFNFVQRLSVRNDCQAFRQQKITRISVRNFFYFAFFPLAFYVRF